LCLAPPRCSLEKGGVRALSRTPPFRGLGPPFPSPLYVSDRSKPSWGLSF
jgi:hypothetical protein